MKLKNALLLLGILLMTQVNAQKVTTDLDKDYDFTKLKTYTFLGWQNNSDQLLNDLDKERLRKAFASEFNRRQLQRVEGDEADIAVTVFFVLEQKTSTTAYTDYYDGGYGGYRRGAWGWGGGSSTTTYSESDYIEGTLVLDFYDNKSKNLIWQSVARGTINENPKKREKSIPKAVKKIMKNYPIEPLD